MSCQAAIIAERERQIDSFAVILNIDKLHAVLYIRKLRRNRNGEAGHEF